MSAGKRRGKEEDKFHKILTIENQYITVIFKNSKNSTKKIVVYVDLFSHICNMKFENIYNE